MKGVGIHAPAVLIVSFVPIFLVSLGYKYLNRADPDCGTTFAWATRAFGPYLGWINGWAIFVADVIVMASLSVIAAQYTYLLVGWQSADNSTAGHHHSGVLDRDHDVDLLPRDRALRPDTAVPPERGSSDPRDLRRRRARQGLPGTRRRLAPPELGWFNPFAISFSALTDGVLLGIFIYWGWDSGVSVNEESENSAKDRERPR